MKYIRTKDGIYKRREDTYIEDNSLYQIGYDFGRICLGKVIAQSDTIEELCDGFYIDDKLLNRFNKYAMFEKDQYEKFKDITITYTKGKIPLVAYGFVKTDKGLIYVAKMDSEGKLVLI